MAIAGKGGLPLVIEATNSPSDLGTRYAPRGLEARSFLRAFRTATPIRFPPRRRAAAAQG